MQLLFVVETNKKCESDKIYIDTFIKHFYNINSFKISFVYMDGKSKFDSNSVIKDIETKIAKYGKKDNTKVIYCIDIDNGKDTTANNTNIKLNESIKKFTNNNDYDLIWFYEDIENVFLGHKVKSNDKKKEAIKFITKIDKIEFDFKKLEKQENVFINHTSNICLVLKKYLTMNSNKNVK